MADNTIDSLRINVVESGTENAVEKLQSLLRILREIKSASYSKGSSDTSFEKTADAAASINSEGVEKLHKLTTSIKEISQASKQKISSSIAKQITKIGSAVDGLKSIDMSKLTEMAAGIKALKEIGIDSVNFTSPKIDTGVASQGNVNSTPVIENTPDSSGMTTFTSEVSKASSRVGKLNDQLRNIKKILSSMKLGKYFAEAGKQISTANSKIKRFFSSITRIAKYRMIRSALTAISKCLKDGITNLYQYSKATDNVFSKSMDSIATSLLYLKNSIATVLAPAIDSIAPTIDEIIDKIVSFINMLSRAVAIMTGASTYKKAIKYSTKYADSVNDSVEANKKLKQSMLGIDEINVLSDNSSNSSNSNSNTPQYSDMFETVSVGSDDIVLDIKHKIAQIEEILSIASLAVGAILTFTGANIPIGVALMSIGAAGLAKSAKLDWETTNNKVQSVVNIITGIVGGALLAIGGILAFSGANVPLGLGILAIGALTLGSSIALNWEGIPDNVKNVIALITTIISAASFVIGTVLAFSGAHVGLGLALMAAGAAGMATAVTTSWDSIPQSIKSKISTIMEILGGALLVVGAVLAFTGANIPLGIGLMISGAASLGTAVSLNWDSIVSSITTAFSNIKEKFSVFVQPIIDAWNGFKENAKEVWVNFKAIVSDLWTSAVDRWNDLKEVTKELKTKISCILSEAWNNAVKKWNDLKETTKMLCVEFKSLVSKGWEKIIETYNNLRDKTVCLKTAVSDKIGKAKVGVATWWSETKKKFVDATASVKTSVTDKDNKLKSLSTLWSGLKDKATKTISIVGTALDKDGKMKSLSSLWGKFKDKAKKSVGITADATDKGGNVGALWSTWNTIKSKLITATADAVDKGGNVGALWVTWGSIKSKTATITAKLSDRFSSAFKTMICNVIDLMNSMIEKVNNVLPQKYEITPVQYPSWAQYADGGMPPTGDIFIANEAGPELVGRIGRRTAVANQDQIVASVSSGVSQGVYEANAQQNALLREQNELLRKLLAKDNTATISTGQITSALDRANRRNGKVTVPVG